MSLSSHFRHATSTNTMSLSSRYFSNTAADSQFTRCTSTNITPEKRPIAKALRQCEGWQQQRRAIENIISLRKHGWKGVNMQLLLDASSIDEKLLLNSAPIVGDK
jgi:hypothetical protein